ncbi:MAG: FtsL-like putative cell division protein [Bacteroidia bacterium]|nr:FtsL-like putative cell division protein [Bacteroidia bacterium]
MKENRARIRSTQPVEESSTTEQSPPSTPVNGKQSTDPISPFLFIRKNMGFTLFLTLLGLVYIYSSHRAERQVKEMETLQRELRELKSEYMTLNAELGLARKQSEVAERLDSLGLEELKKPPYRLNRNP